MAYLICVRISVRTCVILAVYAGKLKVPGRGLCRPWLLTPQSGSCDDGDGGEGIAEQSG